MAYALALGSLLAAIVLSTASRSAPDSSSILTRHLEYSERDVQAIENGEVVSHSLSADGSEVAITAAAVIQVPVPFYLERFRAIESFKRGAEVLQVGRFSATPSAADLQALTVEPGDIEDLRKCRPGNCDVKIDAAGVTRIAPLETGKVEDAYKVHLAAYAARYLKEGNPSLMEFHDQGEPRPLGNELRQIVQRSPYLRREWPAIGTAVTDFRGSMPAGTEHFLYWSKEKPPGKAIVSLTHAIIQRDAAGAAVVATKQLYASHYMTGSLGLTVLIDRGTPGSPRTLLIYVNRTRLDIFDGVFGKLKRPIVRSRARAGAERMLGRLRDRLHAEWAARATATSRF